MKVIDSQRHRRLIATAIAGAIVAVIAEHFIKPEVDRKVRRRS